ncbi:Vacuolar protein sorting-associated protein IST1 [Elsinoe australis]|uniref:Vacuolar protein sorting-associated protein IST1 n=1 Tax=Elsinoe australis TaxID=40998 RepID=A0A2P8A8U7_9PEZI|nr:Vacuolar protein sorting-associated protein IST1 [Elsinoe australis]
MPAVPPSDNLQNKLKVQLKLSISRLRMVQQKDTAIAKQQRRAMAQLLEQGKLESARIRVENIIRSDLTTELLEILELYSELLLARAGLLEAKECDPGLEEAVQSLIYAAPRTEIKELHTVRNLLAEKFGKEFALAASENADGKVSKRVTERLRVEPPRTELVEAYLSTIAEAYGVDYPPGSKKKREEEEEAGGEEDDDEPGDGEKVRALEATVEAEELSRATPPRDVGPKSPVSVNPPKPSTENPKPEVRVPGPVELKPGPKMMGGNKGVNGTANTAAAGKKKEEGPGGKIPDVDELAKRFAQLKR